MPASVTEIGTEAFAACAALTLDCSENETARAYAAANAIPTGFADTGAYTLLICGGITAGLLALLLILRAVYRKMKAAEK